MNNLIDPWIYYDALQMFTNDIFGSVRSILINNEPWFVGRDVAACLGYIKVADAVRNHVDNEDKGVFKIETPGGNQDIIFINESGVYSLIFSSRLPIAKEFKHWVTSEVLPAMRRIGFSNSMRLLQEENERLKEENKELKDNKNGLARVNKNTMVLINNMIDKRDQAAKSLINTIDILYGHTLNIKEDNLYEH